MPLNLINPKFSDIQLLLDAVLVHSNYGSTAAHMPISAHPPRPHGIFWRQTGDYEHDYAAFTTGKVPNVGIPIMNTAVGQELKSNFYLVLTDPNGLVNEGIDQMPENGPFITDVGYLVQIDGRDITGVQIMSSLKIWLTNGFPK